MSQMSLLNRSSFRGMFWTQFAGGFNDNFFKNALVILVTFKGIHAAGITPEQLKTATFMKGRGCVNCQKSGYKGRLGIFELMVMNNKIRELAFQGAATTDIRRAAVSTGMTLMYDDGVNKALRGITSLEEVFRVAKKAE